MRAQLISGVLLLSLAAPAAVALQAQSLADIARKEEERRKAIKTPAKVYTNQNIASLPPVSGGSLAASDTVPANAGADKTDADKAAAGDEQKVSAPDPSKDQAYWHNRMQALQTQVDRDESYSAALQTRINALTTDFVNRDDPVQRAAIDRERQKALAELDRLKKAIVDEKKAIGDLEEEARRAGVPPGWLR